MYHNYAFMGVEEGDQAVVGARQARGQSCGAVRWEGGWWRRSMPGPEVPSSWSWLWPAAGAGTALAPGEPQGLRHSQSTAS